MVHRSLPIFSVLLLCTIYTTQQSPFGTVSVTPSVMSEVAKNSISSHVLDIANGHPAAGVEVVAYQLETNGSWRLLSKIQTDSNGRVPIVHPNDELQVATYKLRFETKSYFEALGQETFYPYAEVVFEVTNASIHYHVPLTLSNYGYSTYKGQ
uniref:5-hydroxyisourate hydrolase n=1 Tax=Panagrellus redivivus TaxID=6233 RepID=A0A7E4ZTW0_PANRE